MTLPRVTEILQAVGLGPDFGMVAPAVLAEARARGVAVHAAIEADHYGYDVPVSAPIAPYLDAYRKFVSESGHEPIASEFAVIHPVWQYVGHPDRLAWMMGTRGIVDWKTGDVVDLATAGYQLGAYRLAWNAEHPAEVVEWLAVVQLRGDGTYRFHEVLGSECEQTFLAALVVYRAQRGH